jgi:hypothetical protein
MLFCMAVPAFALTGSESYSYIDTGIGVRVTCESKLTLLKGTSKLTLSFENNLNHFPEEDYTSIAKVTLRFTDGTSVWRTESLTGLTVTASRSTSQKTVSKSTHQYFIFSDTNEVYSKTFQ